jgi:hypothetical protein
MSLRQPVVFVQPAIHKERIMSSRYQMNKMFLDDVVRGIEGWLQDFAAICSMDMLDAQDDRAISGSYLEIGVYGGKYFSLLYRHAGRDNSHAVGLDPFSMLPQQMVLDNLSKVDRARETGNSARLTLLKDFSTNRFPDELLAILGQRPRFVSIDGSHLKPDVYWDLSIADTIAGAGAIVAIDDYLSPYNVGVNEAVNHFFTQAPRNLIPFAYVQNKLFLARRMHAAFYKQRLERFINDAHGWPAAETFRTRAAQNRVLVERMLFGSEILIIP